MTSPLVVSGCFQSILINDETYLVNKLQDDAAFVS